LKTLSREKYVHFCISRVDKIIIARNRQSRITPKSSIFRSPVFYRFSLSHEKYETSTCIIGNLIVQKNTHKSVDPMPSSWYHINMMKTKETKMSDPMNELIDGVALAILKVRFYDPEPDMYDSLDSFWLELDEDHWLDARQEAEAAIAAVQTQAAIVPKAATPAMAIDGVGVLHDSFSGDCESDASNAYTAMISASPYAPEETK
jgi:hypothetical protein